MASESREPGSTGKVPQTMVKMWWRSGLPGAYLEGRLLELGRERFQW
jgi:hypothetical protein